MLVSDTPTSGLVSSLSLFSQGSQISSVHASEKYLTWAEVT